MEFPKVLDLCDYFRRFPPPHLALRQLTQMFAAAFGIRIGQHSESRPPLTNTEQTVTSRAGMTREVGITTWDQLPPDVRALAEQRKKEKAHGG
jgi:hypothetical protein